MQTLELGGTGLRYPSDLAVVPEPGVPELLAAGALLLAALARRRA